MKYLALVFLVLSLSVQAAPELCFDEAGRDYGIDPILLMAISIQESRLNPRAINSTSAGGTEDVCAMQLNSNNFGKLKRFNITRADLLNNPCICVYSGAWILARNFQAYGRNWDSVGIYNAGPRPELMKARREYAKIIKSIYTVLIARKKILETRAGDPVTVSPFDDKTDATTKINDIKKPG
ncbi:transglycosylase SLT domain-containing protein [Metakosakonia massiliensis]|uniref:Transglycosylase SLT domain protein n=1 Tax=Phytobacter massiliensis TaxID=1485952 RepID=A0A6N3EAH2_9ENTR